MYGPLAPSPAFSAAASDWCMAYRGADDVVATRQQRRRSAVTDVIARCRQNLVVRLQQPVTDSHVTNIHTRSYVHVGTAECPP